MSLYQLEQKFNKSGIDGNPVISDLELIDLERGLREIQQYFIESGDRIIVVGLSSKINSVANMIKARYMDRKRGW